MLAISDQKSQNFSIFNTEFKAEYLNEIFPLTASYVTASIETALHFSPLKKKDSLRSSVFGSLLKILCSSLR